jgi:hypothetical protein
MENTALLFLTLGGLFLAGLVADRSGGAHACRG